MLRFALALALAAAASGAAAQAPNSPSSDVPNRTDADVRESVEVVPTLIGGLDGLQQRMEYPEMARRSGIEGRVFVQFVVDESGAVSDAACVGPETHPLLCEAAINAVVASRFTPGLQDGQPVKVLFTLPVQFSLQGGGCLGIL